MTGEVIVKDTIAVSPAYDDIFNVTALVTATTREEGRYVSILWNSATGAEVARTALVAEYVNLFTCPAAVLTDQLKTAIGTDMPVVEPEQTEPVVTVNAASVTVVNGGA